MIRGDFTRGICRFLGRRVRRDGQTGGSGWLLAVRAAVDPAALLLKEAKSFYGSGGSVKDKPNKMQDLSMIFR